jgi:tetratricopeptide (TPR) repeat protein
MVLTRTRQQRLHELVDEFCSGKKLSPLLDSALSSTTFNRIIEEHMERLPIAERLLAAWSRNRSFDGLAAARNGDLATADQLLTEAMGAFRRLDVCAISGALARSAYWASRAYLFYRRNQFDDAQEALYQANSADLRLIEHGISIMHVHRVQLVQNLARIEIRRGNGVLAAAYTRRLLDHLDGKPIPELPLAGPWHSSLLDPCPIELVAAMIAQATTATHT